ncbi:MAG: ABC transporter ATP-binding protein [Clostridia bacterium]|nr:ABC transporter ATP-binding protein [Clostridia bacterium]
MPKIVLTDVTKRWGDFYGVDHLDLVIDDCSFVTLLGPSGCGKTTTLRMIAGLETPTSGRIEIGDQVVFDSEKGINVPANKRHVGFLFQNYALWPNMTVYQNIAFGLKNLKKYSKQEIDEIVQRVAHVVKIEPFMDRYPSELSGGQQQRVAIARTLAPEPQVIFMDEPLSNLDAKLRLEMRSELQRLHLTTGRTFVYVTHDQMEAMTLASRICLIENGVLQQYDPPLTVYGKPNNLFVADFVGSPSINFIDANGTQKADGTVDFDILGDKKVTFSFNDKVDIAEWRAEEKRTDEELAAVKAERAKDKKHVEKGNKDKVFDYKIMRVDDDGAEKAEPTENDYVIGVRPEMINICEDGGIEAEVYSAMPTGMETTVRLRVGNFLLTGVVFGGVTYDIGATVHIRFKENGIMLFSRMTGRLIGNGSLKV